MAPGTRHGLAPVPCRCSSFCTIFTLEHSLAATYMPARSPAPARAVAIHKTIGTCLAAQPHYLIFPGGAHSVQPRRHALLCGCARWLRAALGGCGLEMKDHWQTAAHDVSCGLPDSHGSIRRTGFTEHASISSTKRCADAALQPGTMSWLATAVERSV